MSSSPINVPKMPKAAASTQTAFSAWGIDPNWSILFYVVWGVMYAFTFFWLPGLPGVMLTKSISWYYLLYTVIM